MNWKNKIRKILASYSSVKKYHWPTEQKVVSFTFDDVDKSAFQNAGGMLNEHGMKGTFYVALSFMEGQPGNESIFDQSDLATCIEQGHELGCHTHGHLHAFDHTFREMQHDINRNKEVLHSLGLGVEFESFSYPYGEQTRSIKGLADKLYTSARSIEHGINRGTMDLNSLKTFRLYENKHSIEDINSALQELNDQGGWLIFYTHDVQANFSPYGCSPDYFKQAVELVQKFNLEVKTVADVIA